MLQEIGKLVDNCYELDLLPGIKLLPGTYQISIRYTVNTGGHISMHYLYSNPGWNSNPLMYKVGRDVTLISLDIKSLDNKNPVSYYYIARIDDLILLNLALKLINKPSLP